MTKTPLAAAMTAGAMLALPVHAELSAEELAKIAQNPVGAMISVPFQNNTNFDVGTESGTKTS